MPPWEDDESDGVVVDGNDVDEDVVDIGVYPSLRLFVDDLEGSNLPQTSRRHPIPLVLEFLSLFV